VGNREYTSQQVRTRGTASKHDSDVTPLLTLYPVGKEVEIHHDPDNPAEAYLEAGVDFINYILITAPLVFAILGLYVFVVTLWETAKAE
jgi:hypothetical protein